MAAYYNEFDKKTAAWLRELIKNNLIADGEVDERSIIDVQADDLRGITRAHWFAGIAGWDYALQLAGWPENRPVWTASLPCQPFSCAGKQLGKSDERHLLPYFISLVVECRPSVIFGEQVPGAIRHGWLDDLCDEMERLGYTVRAAVLTAAGIGAPHLRARLYWVAYSANSGREPQQNEQSSGLCRTVLQQIEQRLESGDLCTALGRMAYDSSERSQKQQRNRGVPPGTNGNDAGEDIAGSGRMGDSESTGTCKDERRLRSLQYELSPWCYPVWFPCRDGKYRPIKPGIKPVVNGISKGMVRGGDTGIQEDTDNTQEARAMRLKGYGNAIAPKVAAEFISAFMDVIL